MNTRRLFSWCCIICAILIVLSLAPHLSVALRNLLVEEPGQAGVCPERTGAIIERARQAVPAVDGKRCGIAAMTAAALLRSSSPEIRVTDRVAMVRTLLADQSNSWLGGSDGTGMPIGFWGMQARDWIGGHWHGESYWTPRDLQSAVEHHPVVVVSLDAQTIWSRMQQCRYFDWTNSWNGLGGSHVVTIVGSTGHLSDNSLTYMVADGGLPEHPVPGAGREGQQDGAVYPVDALTMHRAIVRNQENLVVPTFFYEDQ